MSKSSLPVRGTGRPTGRAPELLSPAGDRESLEAALKNGADAVYLGTREFNARILARNFSLEELGRVVDLSHHRGVRVYLALNTLVKNREIGRFFDTLSRAYLAGIDGVIIQHVSFLELIKRWFPGLPVFLSTQAAVGNVAAAGLFKTADRIILPRELSLDEVRAIVRSGVSAEVFVHGALCFSYSGLCLMSGFVGNRSGNRGCCAQLCRKPYNGSYCLSTRELCLVRRVPELIEAGISGFKIEGRMRSPLYVAVATRLYRKAIDSYHEGRFVVPDKEMSEIEVVFNREFTEGFMFGARNLLSPEKPMNRGAFLGVLESGQIVLQRPVAVGDGVGIWGKKAVTGAIIKRLVVDGRAVSAARTGQRVDLGLEVKDGARIYLTSSTGISAEPDFVLCREPIETIKRKPAGIQLPRIPVRHGGQLRLMVKAYSLAEAVESLGAGADSVLYDVFAGDFPASGQGEVKSKLGAFLPRIADDAMLADALERLREKRPSAVLAGNLGFLAFRDRFFAPVYLDYSLNAFNDLDLEFFRRFRVTPVLSPELSLDELGSFRSHDAVILCHGDLVVMNTRIEIAANELVDEQGYVFPVRREDGYWQVLNSRPLGLFNDVRKLVAMGFSQFLIDKAGEGPRWVRVYREMLEHEVSDRRLRRGYTSGHLYRPVL